MYVFFVVIGFVVVKIVKFVVVVSVYVKIYLDFKLVFIYIVFNFVIVIEFGVCC